MERLFSEYELWEVTITCRKCRKEFLVFSTRYPGFSDREMYICPFCGSELGEIKADMGYVTVGYRDLDEKESEENSE